VEKINSLAPQCPTGFRSDENKLRFLRNAVLTEPWASQAISQITTSRFTYNGLATALREQLQLSEEKKALAGPSRTMFQQYGRNPQQVSRYAQNATRPVNRKSFDFKKKNAIGRDGKRMLCYLCGGDDHLASKCPPGAAKRSFRDKLEHGATAVNILSELVSNLETSSFAAEDDAVETSAVGHDHSSELNAFDDLCRGTTEVDNDPSINIDTGFYETIDEAQAVNHIGSAMEQPVNGEVIDEPGVVAGNALFQ